MSKVTVTYKSGRVEIYEDLSGWGGEPDVPFTLQFDHFPNGWPTSSGEDARNEAEVRVNISLFSIEDARWES